MPRARHEVAELLRHFFGHTAHLLVSLLLLVAIGPLVDGWFLGRAVWELLFTLVMASTVVSLSRRRAEALIAVALALPASTVMWLHFVLPHVALAYVALPLLIAFLVYTAAALLIYVFTAEAVTMDTLAGAFSVYLLMGYLWGMVYGLIYLYSPEAFHLPDDLSREATRGLTGIVPIIALVYYSFATLTTVGYGDIYATAGISRAMAILEMVIGQFYLAVLVARLVGLHLLDLRK